MLVIGIKLYDLNLMGQQLPKAFCEDVMEDGAPEPMSSVQVSALSLATFFG